MVTVIRHISGRVTQHMFSLPNFRRFSCLMLTACLSVSSGESAAADQCRAAPALSKGLNVLGSPTFWAGKDNGMYRAVDMDAMASAGFDHVRINAMPFDSMDSGGTIDPKWLQRLDMAIEGASSAGLAVIIDLHEHVFCARDASECERKTLLFWTEISARYQDRPSTVFFEILNEPHGALDDSRWNKLLASALQVIRKRDTCRQVIIGPASSNDLRKLNELRLPQADRRLVVTFHYYIPFNFTHQGAAWTKHRYPPGVSWSAATQMPAIIRDFETVSRWSRLNDRPILLGEFGVLNTTDVNERAEWINSIICLAREAGIGWSYWNFNGNSFGVFERNTKSWVPEVKAALTGPQSSTSCPDHDIDGPSRVEGSPPG